MYLAFLAKRERPADLLYVVKGLGRQVQVVGVLWQGLGLNLIQTLL